MSRTFDISAEPSWFEDPDSVLAVLRNDPRIRGVQPQVAGYDDLRELHRGGQGVIYSAVQRSTRRRVAIKVLLDGMYASAAARLRFEREIDLAAQLRHPNIVRIYDSGVTPDGRMYYVMEYIEGDTLDQYVLTHHGDRNSDTPALKLFTKICNAIHHAHQHGVIHRDLKPSNVRVDAAGEPHVLDFGLATSDEHRAIGESDGRPLTVTGHFMGSLAWASPEQIRGDFRNVDVRSDVYALGVMLYQMLTGRLPYDTDGGLHDVADRIVNQPPLRPRAAAPGVSDELEAVVLKCLAKEPERRYQSGAELSADIRRHLAGEPVLARGDSAWYTLSKLVRRHRAVSTAIIVIAVLIIGFAATMSFMYGQTLAERTRAEAAASRATVVRGFLEDMLSSVDPSKSGYRVTVAEVLDEAQAKVDGEFRTDPEIEASLRYTLGESYLSLGLYDKGAQQLRRAVEIRRRVLGDEHPDTLDAIEAYAGWAPDQQEDLLRLVLLARRKSQGPGHEAGVRVACNFAGFLIHDDRADEAASLLDELLPTAERALGADHHETLRARSCLGELLRRQGRLADAEQIARGVLEVRRRHPDPEHRFTLAAMDSLALVLRDAGQYGEAETLIRYGNRVYRRVLGEPHPVSIGSTIHLVRLLLAQGQLEEAEHLARKTLDTCRDNGTSAFAEFELRMLMALIHRDRHELGEAERQLADVVTHLRPLSETDSWLLTEALRHSAGVLAAQQRYEAALPLLSESLDWLRERPACHRLELALTLTDLGDCLAHMNRTAESAQHLRESRDILNDMLGPDDPRTRRAADILTQAHATESRVP